MKTVGRLLQESRESQRRSVKELSEIIKVREDFLIAIEEERFTDIPKGPFARGFVRSYAQAVGLDPNHVLAIYRRDFGQDLGIEGIPKGTLRPLRRKKIIQFTPQTLGALIIVGIVGLFLFYQWKTFQKPPTLTIYEPSEGQQAQRFVLVSGVTATDAVVLVNTKPVTLNQDGEFRTELEFSQGEHYVIVEAVGREGKRQIVQRKVFVVK